MDSDAKYSKQQDDVVGSPLPTFSYDNNSYNFKPQTIDDDGFSVQDFQHLDHLIASYGTSDYPDFGSIQQHPYPAEDPFDVPPYGFSPNSLSFYDAKPFAGMSYGGGGSGSAMEAVDAFHGGGVGFLGQSLSERQGIGMNGGGEAHRSVAEQPFLGYQQQQSLKPVSFVISDELSCTTVGVGGGNYKNGVSTTTGKGKPVTTETTRRTCKRRENKKPSNVVKGQWTVEEDRLLIQLVDQYGVRKWSFIAQMLKGRIGKQCRERWHNHLRPNIKKDTWTEEEDGILIRAHEEIGNKWAEIAKRLPGRTENNIKNHWNATKRRQYSRRKCRSKFPRQSSLLQNYIKSLNLTSTASAPKHDGSNKSPTSIATKDKIPAAAVMPARAPSHHHHRHHCRQEHFNNSSSVVRTEEFCSGAADQLIPGFEFNHINEEFPFRDSILFRDQCSIDSMLDDIPPCGNDVDENESKDIEMDMMPFDHMASLMQFEVKKELDLVEMISQTS